MLKELTDLFGDSIRVGPQPGQTPPYTGAAVIYKTLTDPEFNSRDLK